MRLAVMLVISPILWKARGWSSIEIIKGEIAWALVLGIACVLGILYDRRKKK